jgi:sugar phosphate isomerase/epimerase
MPATEHPAWRPLPAPHARRPFRLGVTSCVYPADLLPNAAMLAPAADDIEVVLFEADGLSGLPSPAVVAELAALCARHGTTCTVHLPLDLRLGDRDRAARSRSVACGRRILALAAPLDPFAFILHLAPVAPDAPPAEVRRWQAAAEDSLRRLLDASGVAPALIAVENLDFPFEWCAELIDRLGLSVCIDIGHLRLRGLSVTEHLGRHLPRARVVHLHGERQGRDHQSLAVEPAERLTPVLAALDRFAGVVTLELFDFEAVASSIRLLNRWFDARGRDAPGGRHPRRTQHAADRPPREEARTQAQA